MNVKRYRYLVVGGGMAGHAALAAIRTVDPDGAIGLIGEEPTGPYRRPPLSKGLWRDEALESIWLPTRIEGLEVRTGRRVTSIDRGSRTVVDDRGETTGYERLLIATGGAPRRLSGGGDRVIHYRTLGDYERLRALARPGARVAVVGGGFIGSEVAAALASNDVETTMIFPEETLCARVFPGEVGRHLVEEYRSRGVRVMERSTVEAIEEGPARQVTVRVSGGTSLEVDAVVVGIGIKPSVELASACGLRVEDGVVVDRSLRTTDPLVFAAGDVARFHNPALGVPIRVEHEDAAVTMGEAAGRSMAGEPISYDHLPFFYSDLFDIGYEAVGITDSRMQVVADWAEPYQRGFLYYLSDGRVRGVVCWGVPRRIEEARALVASPGPYRAADLAGRLAP